MNLDLCERLQIAHLLDFILHSLHTFVLSNATVPTVHYSHRRYFKFQYESQCFLLILYVIF